MKFFVDSIIPFGSVSAAVFSISSKQPLPGKGSSHVDVPSMLLNQYGSCESSSKHSSHSSSPPLLSSSPMTKAEEESGRLDWKESWLRLVSSIDMGIGESDGEK